MLVMAAALAAPVGANDLDAAGALIGMHAQIYSSSGGYQGLSFAVPIDVVPKVKDHLVAHGRMPHGYLGVTIQSLNPTLASAFGLVSSQGAEPGLRLCAGSSSRDDSCRKVIELHRIPCGSMRCSPTVFRGIP